ncbi:MAG: SNF2-related protein [Ilumatobacteraceae bacterium]
MAVPSVAERAGRLEVTWARDGLLAWQPAASRTGGNLRTTMSRSFAGGGPWSHTTIAQVRLPFGTLQVIGQHIAPGAFVTMGDVADGASDSLRWFAAARDAAIELVRAGQVVPVVTGGAGRTWQATWRPAAGPGGELVAALAASMPPVCAAAFVLDHPDGHEPAVLAAEVLDRLIDVGARAVLRATGWRADLGTTRSPAASAARAVGRGLSDLVDLAPVANPAVEVELAAVAGALERIARRVGGLPVVVPRLRLALPGEPDGDWPVNLELVDVDDRSRWCTLAELAAGAPAALALAGRGGHGADPPTAASTDPADRSPVDGRPAVGHDGTGEALEPPCDGDQTFDRRVAAVDHVATAATTRLTGSGTTNTTIAVRPADVDSGHTATRHPSAPATVDLTATQPVEGGRTASTAAHAAGGERTSHPATVLAATAAAPVSDGHDDTDGRVGLALGLLRQVADDAAQRLTTLLPEVVDALVEPEPAVDVDAAAQVLERYDDVSAAGIEVLVPEQLARRRPQVRATATPAGEGSGRFGAAALLDWRLVVDGDAVDEAALQRAADQATTLLEVGGRWVRLEGADVRRALDAVAEHRQEHGEVSTLGLLRLAAELDEQASTGDGGDDLDGDPRAATTIAAPDGWLADLLDGLPDTSLADGDVPAGLAATLRPYQRRGLGWLQFLERLGLGGCLADDMGLGKTVQLLGHLAGRDGPHLVLCPLSVVRNWQQEAARFVPLARLLVLHGTDRPRAAALQRAVAAADIVITTYQSATRDIDALAEVGWTTVVLDEAQAVKNPHTHAAKAVRRLPAQQRIALTGTPVENRLGELWAILDAVAPGLLGSEAHFRERFAIPIERRHDEAAAAALRRMTAPFLLRRTKADKSLVPDLPNKVEQVAWATLTREQATMYQAVVDQLLLDAEQASGMKRRGLVLAALTRLKQICNHPAHALGDGSRLGGRSGKLARFDELVTDLLDAGEQALVFTQYRVMGELLARHVGERFQLAAPFLHGGVARTSRDRMVARFQDGEGSPLLIVSLKAGGTGLNLTAASRVVHYDRWWNPAVEDQATDRAWRIGQTQSVFVHKLVCQGTVEERVAQLIDDKRALADAVVGTGGEQWLSELSTDELRGLVTLDRAAVTP